MLQPWQYDKVIVSSDASKHYKRVSPQPYNGPLYFKHLPEPLLRGTVDVTARATLTTKRDVDVMYCALFVDKSAWDDNAWQQQNTRDLFLVLCAVPRSGMRRLSSALFEGGLFQHDIWEEKSSHLASCLMAQQGTTTPNKVVEHSRYSSSTWRASYISQTDMTTQTMKNMLETDRGEKETPTPSWTLKFLYG